MRPGDWKRCRALALREAAGSLRSRYWLLRWVFALLVCLAVCLVIARGEERVLSAGPAEIGLLAEEVASTLCLAGYLTAVFLFPAVAITGIEARRKSGFLDLLITSPLSEGQVLLSIALGRILAAASFFLAAVPVLAIPFYLGPSSLGGALIRGLAASLLAASLSSTFALYLLTKGSSPREIGWRLAAFVVFTPSALPIGLWILCLPLLLVLVMILRFQSDSIQQMSIFSILPFLSLGQLAGGHAPPLFVVPAGVLVIFAVAFFFRKALREGPHWLRRKELSRTYEPRMEMSRSRDPDSWRNCLARLEEGWRTGIRPAPAQSQASSSPPRRAADLKRWVYRATGRNALVFRQLRASEVKGLLYLLFLVLAFDLSPFPTAFFPEAERVAAMFGFLKAASLLFGALVAAQEGSALLHPPSRGPLLETLLSTPVTGRELARGGLVVAALRIFPALPLFLFFGLLELLLGSSPAGSFSWLLLFPASVLLGYGLSVWLGLLLGSRLKAAASSLFLFFLMLVGGAWLFSGQWGIGGSTPGELLLYGEPAGLIFFLSTALSLAGLALIESFARSFRSRAAFRREPEKHATS